MKQHGTGHHIDVDPLDPFESGGRVRWRPFQALIALSDQHPGDASLEVVAGFHRVCTPWYVLTWNGTPKPVGEWGFTVKIDRDQDRPIIDRFRVAHRIPTGWSADGLPEPPLFETTADVIAWLDRCQTELSAQPVRPVQAGDYVLWDPRMAHANGASNTSSVVRRCMYHAYVPAIGAHAALRSWILDRRRQGLLRAEVRWGKSPDHQPLPLSPGFERMLYGLEPWKLPLPGPQPDPPLLTEAHHAFFRRYGYVVVEGVIDADTVNRVNLATEDFIKEHSGVDVHRPQQTLTAQRWSKVGDSFGGMLQTEWLTEMERIRLMKRPYAATVELLRSTWYQRTVPFEHPFDDLDPEKLWSYPDRQNFRWPDAVLASLPPP